MLDVERNCRLSSEIHPGGTAGMELSTSLVYAYTAERLNLLTSEALPP